MRCNRRLRTILWPAAMLTLASCTLLPATVSQAPTDSGAKPQTPAQQEAVPAPAQPPAPTETHIHAQPEFLVMIDPGHGGDDPGAVLSDTLTEKEVTLALARRLKAELQERGIAVRLLRDEDITLGLEQRALAVNTQHAALYLAIHAGTLGSGVRVYASALAASSPGGSRFLPWSTAQMPYLTRSRSLASAVAAELDKKGLQAVSLSTPLRPLNNIGTTAIAIELTAEREKIQQVFAQKSQASVAATVARAIAQLRPQWERPQ